MENCQPAHEETPTLAFLGICRHIPHINTQMKVEIMRSYVCDLNAACLSDASSLTEGLHILAVQGKRETLTLRNFKKKRKLRLNVITRWTRRVPVMSHMHRHSPRHTHTFPCVTHTNIYSVACTLTSCPFICFRMEHGVVWRAAACFLCPFIYFRVLSSTMMK